MLRSSLPINYHFTHRHIYNLFLFLYSSTIYIHNTFSCLHTVRFSFFLLFTWVQNCSMNLPCFVHVYQVRNVITLVAQCDIIISIFMVLFCLLMSVSHPLNTTPLNNPLLSVTPIVERFSEFTLISNMHLYQSLPINL